MADGPWAKFAAKLEAFVDTLIDAMTTADEIVRLTATGLLCRTFHHFRAIRTLVTMGLVVEARVLTRCCFENLFWIAALAQRGEIFIREAANDHEVNNAKFGKAILEWSQKNVGDPAAEEPLKAYLANLKENAEGKYGIALYNAAVAGKVQDAYIIYRGLSSDAAHPTARSVDRHIARSNGRNSISKTQLLEDEEVEATLHFACTALVGVCVAAQDVLKSPLQDKARGLVTEYLALHKPQ